MKSRACIPISVIAIICFYLIFLSGCKAYMEGNAEAKRIRTEASQYAISCMKSKYGITAKVLGVQLKLLTPA